MSIKINHVSFIMDGNNRWSKKNDISKFDSYKQGANKLIEITNFIFEKYDIDYVSAFALSKHNFKRGSVLLDVIRKILIDFLDPSKNVNNFKYKIKFNGNLNFLPKKIVENIKKLEKKNSKSRKKLVIFLNYSGKDDILNAAKSISQINPDKINHKIFQSFLLSSRIPDPDILIRTGGYKRVSDFMLYQISFTELFFTNKLWPNITISDVKKFIEKFNKIDRKFGN